MQSSRSIRRFAGLVIALQAAAVTGCGDSSAVPSATGVSSDGAHPAVTVAESPETPESLVERYLAAVKQGDAASVNRLLTTKAQQKTMEMNIAVAPAGSETASYQVGAASAVVDQSDLAHVRSHWTELNEAGIPQTIEIIWIVRKEPVGWRVSGMMGQFVEGQPPIRFNFEDPEEVIRQQAYARDEVIERQTGPRQATGPTTSPTQRQ